MFSFVSNITDCLTISASMVYGDINILYYAHIPTILISLIIAIFVFKKSKELSAKALFILNSLFSLWLILNLITWVSTNSIAIMFSWGIIGIVEGLFLIASLYFAYIFIYNKYPPLLLSVLACLMFVPIVVMTPFKYNLDGFDFNNCTAIYNYFLHYISFFEIGITLIVVISSIIGVIKMPKEKMKKNILFTLGISCFLIFFIASSYVVDSTGIFDYEIYGFVGMIIFSAFLAYLIVRFKEFDIKLLGAQALVWALVILIGSQFFSLQITDIPSIIITSLTLIVASILGLAVVRGVKKEISLNEQLGVANDGQKNLIHIMNHQIKGYLGINKNIFAELLTDDYGTVPDTAKPLIQKGFDQSVAGVEYVMSILNGSSAESGALTYEMADLDFKNLVSDVITKKKDVATNKNLTLNFNIEDGKYSMNADQHQLSEAIRNLIDNSIYYTQQGGITVTLKNMNGKIFLTIKDTGVGIKESDKPKLFKSGGVGHDSIKINVQSSGYGLVFSKSVIEAHKGKVWFESEGAGKGTTFFVELPII